MESARSLYKNDIDFAALALQSRDFAKYLNQTGQLDFTDPAAIRQLTTTLLQQDFHLKVEIPEDRLCPPVPNRLNYILWLQDLLDSTAGGLHEGYDRDRDVFGLDIGTGCIGIYPLLGCATRPRWNFVATDIDSNNIRTSRHNVALNNLESRIQIIHSDPTGPLFPLEKLGRQTLDFTMCNPPFYTSPDELKQSAEQKEQEPFSTCTGADVEMVTRGGEVAFVKQMIDESLQLRDRIQWYTSMLGKLSSINVLVETLIKHGVTNFAVTEFEQGSKTKRWAVAWSWGDRRPAMNIARGIPGCPKSLLPFPADYTFTLPPGTSIDASTATINAELSSLPWFWAWDQTRSSGTGYAAENVWSRFARRKMKLAGEEGAAKLKVIPAQVALGVRLQIRLVRGQKPDEKEVRVLVRWAQGTDTVLFESFCGMVKRKLESK
ncbi:S-adenosyl-L-methionine dependent methyltransferase, predicted [Penicillium camemberti]|uniref:S-adenosyl-L-methionine dependent methyltransferase, predicted n=1 Tax=Penicillium camemberti (strain FM 013) TaxID=1429867 RepID=A0A0G4PJK8_PENC3|nr:S-adenosyl-L-methionine dependent methyltransferase, predicted [Penicillium camemberti]